MEHLLQCLDFVNQVPDPNQSQVQRMADCLQALQVGLFLGWMEPCGPLQDGGDAMCLWRGVKGRFEATWDASGPF